MDLQIGGLWVLVTAGASGIGLEIAKAFAREGAKVHVCDVDEAGLDAFAKAVPGATSSVADVSDRASVEHLFETAAAALGGLDCLVNNAGIAGPTARIEAMVPEEWDRTLAVNITGQFNCTRLAVPLLRASANASIVNLSSAAGRFGFPMRTPYSASKWAVVGFTKSLAMELGPDGIRVNAILPGAVDGPRIRSVIENKAREFGKSNEEIQARMLAAASLGKLIPPADLANMAVYLASPIGAAISGQAIAIDGDTQMLV